MAASPPVSVCLLTYNRSELLPATIDSLLAQSFGDFELIVSDDCSADVTEQICRDYEARDRRILYRRNQHRLKMPGNLNSAISLARGALVANLHDGDIYRSDLLQKWVRALTEAPDAAFVFNAYECVERRTKNIRIEQHNFPPVIPVRMLTDRMMFDLTSPVWGTVMARRRCYAESGLFNPRYSWYSDVEMWMRLNTVWPVCYVPEPLISLHVHEDDRPYAVINWSHERMLVAMHEEIIDRVYVEDPVGGALALRRLRRVQDRRWLVKLAVCLKRRDFSLLYQGARMLAAEDRLFVRLIGLAGTGIAGVQEWSNQPMRSKQPPQLRDGNQ
jgi:glycosyltransferase involved in cell wall biosynthesis